MTYILSFFSLVLWGMALECRKRWEFYAVASASLILMLWSKPEVQAALWEVCKDLKR